MSDPERLLKGADPQYARLLASALDEAPPPEGLLERTLDVVTALAPGSIAAGSAAASGAKGAAASGAKGAAALGAKAAGGGITGALAIGGLIGAVVVGASMLVMDTSAPEPPRDPAIGEPHRSALPIAATSIASTSPPPLPSVEPIQPKRTPAVQTIAPLVTARGSDLAAELSLLDDARDALRRGQPERALSLLDRHAREISRPQLGREAATLRAEAARALDAGGAIP